ncbi:MAG TPA: MGMT family protein, partial [Kofleriaceae bacterium]
MAGGIALFDTAIGRCGIAWSARGATRFALPEASPEATCARLVRGLAGPEAAGMEPGPPPAIAAAIALVVQHVAGVPAPLETIEVDLDGVPEFHHEVYAALSRVPAGRPVTYGALARTLGKPGAAPAIGQAMG